MYPGLGHVYLREWLRALLWFGLVITSSTLVIPDTVVPEQPSLDAIVTASQQLPTGAIALLFALTVLSMVDAYWVASRNAHRHDVQNAANCPFCGKELDDDLEFCHWCTSRLDDVPN
ncbi:zinc ribbon domain-containing protein [Haloarculaceae archaeon H-GB11]|nr:zinc ribbon domain-containing protein [Haloarculaceae archaeon H-GB11]